jgi:MFS family permease
MSRLFVLFTIAFVDTVGAAMVVPILPFYAVRYGASAFTVGLLVSAFSIAQLLSAPGWGRLSDRVGRRPALLAGLVISGLAYITFALADSVELLLISRLIQGLGGGTIGVVQAYIADSTGSEQRTRAIGWFTTITSAGWLSGSALGSVLVDVGGERAPGLFTAGLSLAVAGLAAGFLSEPAAQPSSGGHDTIERPKSGFEAIRHVLISWRDPASRLIWIYGIGIGAFYGTGAVLPLLLEARLGITARTIGYIIMYLAGIGVIVRAAILGRMVAWLGEPRLARVGIVLLAAGLALAAAGRGAAVFFTSFTLMPLGTAFLFPSLTGLLSRVVARQERGVFLGVQQTFGGAGRVAFPLLAGLIMDRGGVGSPFWVASALVLVTLPLTATLGKIARAGPR